MLAEDDIAYNLRRVVDVAACGDGWLEAFKRANHSIVPSTKSTLRDKNK
jgi:hypothetical protein